MRCRLPLDLQRFCELRPRLYHLTARENAASIQNERAIRCAAYQLEAARVGGLIRNRRREGLWVDVEGRPVHLRDQRPLHAGNVLLAARWTFGDLVEQLNRHVFFWPGDRDAPIGYGVRHFQRYAAEDARVLVLDTRQVFEANRDPGPRFCRFNSGSPRCSKGVGSPRGPDTFLDAESWRYRPSDVVEVVFPGIARLVRGAVDVRPVSAFA